MRPTPSRERVRELAAEHALDALVVGRVTRLGERLSLDVRLRDAGSGAVAGTYVAELPFRGPHEPVLEHLAGQLLSGALTLAHASFDPEPADAPKTPAPGRASTRTLPTPPGQAQSAPSPGQAQSAPSPGQAQSAPSATLQLDKFDGSEPFSIRSDELEAIEQEGRRKLVFRRNVEARQGDLTLRAGRLEATYPAGAKQPSEIEAEGGVTVRQGDREARCDRATYAQSDEKVHCRGNAVLLDGNDELQGETIVFHLPERRVTVEGGTEVAMTPKPRRSEEGGKRRTPLGPLPGKGPVKIRASTLEAIEEESGARRIRFEGSVEVLQEDLVLRAREIEGVYPPGAKEPEELVATGDVYVLQRGREARCERAVYRRPERRVECHGNASLQRGGDSVTGETISFDLEAEKLVVSGGTRLVLAPASEPETATP